MYETRERWRFRLPHWEVADRPHFVTIRCVGSLPSSALDRIREVHLSLATNPCASPEFAALQRKYFLLCEHYLDAGSGFCPFRERTVCELTIESLRALEGRTHWFVSNFCLMPNHIHLLLQPAENALSLKETLRSWKWYVAREANRALSRTGSFWQSDWFDRWSRTEGETTRMRDYIRHNPVKAGLVSDWKTYPWSR